jgi:hypothetical protein
LPSPPLWLIDDRDDRGRPWFERLTRSGEEGPGWRREARRVAAWVLVMNATYLVTLIGPLVLVRELFGDPSSLVP